MRNFILVLVVLTAVSIITPAIAEPIDLAAALTGQGLQAISFEDLPLNRKASRMNNMEMKIRGIDHPHVGFTWEKGDAVTKDWRPQGIAGIARNGRKWLVVSWYARKPHEEKGCRISFVDVTDMDKIRYRHVLLVEPAADAYLFQGIEGLHAGGLAVLGDNLFVPDTGRGLRIFNLQKIFPAVADPGKKNCGFLDGKALACDYRFFMPQEDFQKLRVEGNGVPRFSFLSVDWTGDSPRLLSGNFHRDADGYRNAPSTLIWWKVVDGRVTGEVERLLLDYSNIQGAAVSEGQLFLSCSWGKNRKDTQLIVLDKAGGNEKIHSSWPLGAEDFHRAKTSDNLWCLTEHEGMRMVFAIHPEDYR